MKKTSVYLPESLKDRLALLARRTGRSEAQLLRLAVERLVADEPSGRQPVAQPVGSPRKPTGHHAGLFRSAGATSAQDRDTARAIDEFLAAGVPPAKLVPGAAFYGKKFRATTADNAGLHQPFESEIGGSFPSEPKRRTPSRSSTATLFPSALNAALCSNGHCVVNTVTPTGGAFSQMRVA